MNRHFGWSIVVGLATAAMVFTASPQNKNQSLGVAYSGGLAKTSVTDSGGQLPMSFYAGVIEGYYGPPWTTPDTKQMIAFLGQHHMNTFVYAPKDDPYQRDQWQTLYPADKLKAIQTLVQAAEAAHVQFVYSISPGLTIQYSRESDRAALIQKLDQLRSIGVHVFMLSLDDIYHGLEGADWNRYHGDMAFAQSALANDIIQVESKQDKHFRLLMTPTNYHGLEDNSYWDSLRVHLNKSVPVIWTGPGPGALSAEITAQQVETVRKDIGHPIIIWDNYPVNDYTYTQEKHPELFMGPVIGRSPDLVSSIAGYLFNPMLQARASEVALWTGGDYLSNPLHYHPNASWNAAISALGGKATPAFRTFVMDSSAYYRDTSPPATLAKDMSDFWRLPTRTNLQKSALNSDWLQMSIVDTELQKGMPDTALYREIEPWAHVLSLQGQLGTLTVDALQAKRDGKPTAGLVQAIHQRLAKLESNPDWIAGNAAEGFAQKALTELSS